MTECDGATMMVSHILSELQVPHHRMSGMVHCRETGAVVVPHCWVKLHDDEGHRWIIDYRLRLWLGDRSDIPHGIFQPNQSFAYEGEEMPPIVLHEALILAFTTPMKLPQ
ncbi:hypothetical protein [Leptolyngbya boryana]|uniref:hypothetical protein n=1 Tax=Leptolyngbya boryana TaxID=1184 RepID=UPI001CEC4BA5|nr:hypothetical protein [Leptolyngbya boryana]